MLHKEGAEEILNRLFRDAGTLYVGLCGNAAAQDFDATLVSITDEPAVANGYARLPLVGNITDWPTIDQVGNMMRALSKEITFTAVSGDYNISITRTFLCDVASGTAGKLWSMSGPLQTPRLVTPTTPFPVKAEQWAGQ